MHLNVKMSFNGRKLARNEQMDRRFMLLIIFYTQGVVCPCLGAICPICLSMTKIFEHLL